MAKLTKRILFNFPVEWAILNDDGAGLHKETKKYAIVITINNYDKFEDYTMKNMPEDDSDVDLRFSYDKNGSVVISFSEMLPICYPTTKNQ